MTTRTTPFAPGTPSWVDLFTSDPERATAFYGALFGWTAQDSGAAFGGYVTFRSQGSRVAGMSRNEPGSGVPDVWATYLATDDADATVARAVTAGATVTMPVTKVGPMGSMAVLLDPSGGVVGLWQAGEVTGFERYNEANSISWDEYHSKDFRATIDFYGQVFGYDYEVTGDSDEFRYRTASVDGGQVAGFMDSAATLGPAEPSNWSIYITVADVDRAVEKLLELGGAVVQPAQDTPFGRLADVADPSGARFKLHATALAGAAVDGKLQDQADATLSAEPGGS